MKYLVVSDSHGHNENLEKVLENEKDLDGVFHCGDLECSFSKMQQICGCELYAVEGNNDYSSDLPSQRIVTLQGHKIGMVHGHRHSVYFDTDRLAYWGEAMNLEVVLFGHTHEPYYRQIGSVTLVNPGSISLPRQIGHTKTYTIMEITPDGVLKFNMKEL